MSLLSIFSRTIKSNRVILSFLIGGLFVYYSNPTTRSTLLGIPFIFIGEGIRTWASGFIKKAKEIAQEGPYALTRNPLYLGTFFIGLGFSLISHNLVILMLFLIIFFLVYTVTIKNEEKELSGKFGAPYIAYKMSVPVFFPRISCIINLPFLLLHSKAGGEASFDWQLVRRHKEFRTWIGIIGVIIIFLFKLGYK